MNETAETESPSALPSIQVMLAQAWDLATAKRQCMKESINVRSFGTVISGFWLLIIVTLNNPAGMDIIDAVVQYLIK